MDLAVFLTPMLDLGTIFYVVLGTLLGVVVGAIPGLNGAMLITLSLPLTFYMEPTHSIVMLVGMYVGAISGGAITAILFRIPGTPASVVTTFDGHPMARQGKADRAIALCLGASLVGGLVAGVFLITLSAPISDWAARLGPFEYFSLVMMAMVLITSVGSGPLWAGMLSGALGMLAAMPGYDPSSGRLRLDFDIPGLDAGLGLLPVLIGLFAVSQVIGEIVDIDRTAKAETIAYRRAFMRLRDYTANAINLLRSSLIGTFIGILPGIGATVGSLVSYSVARNTAAEPERFGKGAEQGVIASEAANNATVGGALIPLIAIGIPGSVIDAILLGAFVIHGMRPGPLLFDNNPEIVHAVMGSYVLACVVMFAALSLASGLIARLMYLPRQAMLPAILVFCVVGAIAANNQISDVWVMFAFGLLGYGMERVGIPLGPFVIGFVLTPIAEESLRSALMMSAGSWAPLATRPISAAFLAIAALLLIAPFVIGLLRRMRRK
ncbi:hypothetical protein DXV76_00890 [Rhodobacteraceae bacterium CCMM004]|nr:hypothetical protein DXV76_00890 [Rhodobacteraceae bacterium CCMM004]